MRSMSRPARLRTVAAESARPSASSVAAADGPPVDAPAAKAALPAHDRPLTTGPNSIRPSTPSACVAANVAPSRAPQSTTRSTPVSVRSVAIARRTSASQTGVASAPWGRSSESPVSA